jgi:hypothetical protein
MEKTKPLRPKKQTSLETANEMFKTAFQVKKSRIRTLNPELSDEDLNKKTALYFRNLSESQK